MDDAPAATWLLAARRDAVPSAWEELPSVTPRDTGSFSPSRSSSVCPEAPKRPLNKTAATASSGDAPVSDALGIEKALVTERCASTLESSSGRPHNAPTIGEITSEQAAVAAVEHKITGILSEKLADCLKILNASAVMAGPRKKEK